MLGNDINDTKLMQRLRNIYDETCCIELDDLWKKILSADPNFKGVIIGLFPN